jgi:hypothetical protein
MKFPDIDIDVADRTAVLNGLKHAKASTLYNDNTLEPHISGIYFQDIPKDYFTNQSNLDINAAEAEGYFKIDILNVSLYKQISSESELIRLMNIEPDWSMLLDKKIVKQLLHINNHYALVAQLKPKSIEQLAAVLAIIRPAKQYLARYTWDKIMEEVWKKPNDGEYHFKRSHSLAYSTAICVQLNMIREKTILNGKA